MPGRVNSPGSQGRRGSKEPSRTLRGPSNSRLDYGREIDQGAFGWKGMGGAGGVSGGDPSSDFRVLTPIPTIAATGVAATDIITATGHDYILNTPVVFAGTSGAAEIVVGTVYFVRDVVGHTFKISATAGGAAIDFIADLTAGTVQRVVTGDASTDTFTSNGHGLTNGQMVQLSVLTGGTGISPTEFYNVVESTGNTFKLTQSMAGTPLNFTTNLTRGTLRRYG